MSENSVWRTMRQRMYPFWDEATRHEDKFNPGIADVSFVCGGKHGWIELKQIDHWPKRESTIVRCKHYTDYQREFLRKKGRHGGNTWLFAKIERDYLLIHWTDAWHFATVNKEATLKLAFAHWYHRVNWEELADILAVGHK